ncbi:MAG TPA: Xaa-Pro peptidase family protein [Baekduia sp.]|uniref:M24 family metallopeptidase n=1 Tax=Baekduia sp. TaxID=2600305 RepID=UPI002D78A93F|nr:Xaa-Pro peptidase family protein [Baekduia sp.]HET6505880.1 Xaa-Pro peptidase family protein [Baekduia sp.]
MFAWPEVDRAVLRAHRHARVRALMDERGLDHLLLTGPDHIRYVTDYRAQIISEAHDWFAVVVDGEGEADVFGPSVGETVLAPVPELPLVRAEHPLPSWCPAIGHPEFWVSSVARELTRRGARHVGYEGLDPALLEGLRAALPSVAFVGVGLDLFLTRQVKHPLEVELVEAAARVNAGAMQRALEVAEVGMTDHDLLAAANAYAQSMGAEFLSHSVCNLRKGSGDWFAHGAEIREGDAFFFDIGCYGVGGYASDAARTGFVGEPPAVVVKAYETLLEAYGELVAAARPGVRASELVARVNGFLRGRGLGETPYSIGHGVGLRGCELPTLHRSELLDRDAALVEGMTIALEPETSLEVDGQVIVLKVEDNFVVESNGLRRLTEAPTLEQVVRA